METYLFETLDHVRRRVPCSSSRNGSRRSRCCATDEVAVNAGLRQRAHCECRDGQERVGSNHNEDENERLRLRRANEIETRECMLMQRSQINITEGESIFFIYQTFAWGVPRYT